MKMTREQKIEFANGIDFSGLFHHVEMLAGQELTFGKPEVKEKSDRVYIEFQSNNIASSCGVFGRILEYCVIGNFSNSVSEDEKTGELYYWVQVSVSYQHRGGGSNGMELLTAWYKNGEWSFRDVAK
jgi:hypothetical protein